MERLRKDYRSGITRKVGAPSQIARRNGIKSIDLAGRIFEALCKNKNAIALSELAKQTRIPASKLHRYLVSLTNMRMVHQDSITRKYSFGPLALEIGAAATSGSDDLSDAIARQVELRNHIDETVSLSVWSARGPIILHVEPANHAVITTIKIGSVLPILETAAGIVFASLLPRSMTGAVIEQELSNHATALNPIVSTSKALERLAVSVRRRGYIHNKGHLLPGVSALAAPVLGRAGQLVGVFSIIGQSVRIDPTRNKTVLAELLRQAGEP
ncbi:MAG: IclR family transcriptional regulator [Xanthobacteraceae bacterium]|nr:IclR family transcriptional regulator [Xanthobacteraceae bacterium]